MVGMALRIQPMDLQGRYGQRPENRRKIRSGQEKGKVMHHTDSIGKIFRGAPNTYRLGSGEITSKP